MTAAALSAAIAAQPGRAVGFRDKLLFAAVISSFLVMIDPSPHELIVSCGLLLLLPSRLRVPRHMPLLLALVIGLDLSGAIAAIQVLERPKVLNFAVTSVFLGLATIFYTLLLSENTAARLETLRRAWIAAALCATFAGILGYFNILGSQALFTAYEGTRAKGTFNDPNVFGPFLVPATIFLAQDVMLERGRIGWRVLAFLLLCLGQFLSFSRASWAHLAGSLLLLVFLTALTTTSRRVRRRLILTSLAGLLMLAGGMGILLSSDQLGKVFSERASLEQSYDTKAGGRFDNYRHALDVILDSPLGIGPFAFSDRFGEDAHDAYLNTFVSYGWVGGLSYLAMVALSLLLAFFALCRASALRNHLVAIISCFFPLTLVSLIIHTDHWRHYFLLLAALWATSAASRKSSHT